MPSPALHGEAATHVPAPGRYPVLPRVPRTATISRPTRPDPVCSPRPLYLLPIALGVAADPMSAGRLEKLAAAIITALSVLFLYWALAWCDEPGWAYVIALVYAFGTSSLSVSSQALWQHGPSQLFLALTLYCLVKGSSDDRYFALRRLPDGGCRRHAVDRSPARRARRRMDRLRAPATCRGSLALSAFCRRSRPSPPTTSPTSAKENHGLGHTTAPVWALFTQTPLREGLTGRALHARAADSSSTHRCSSSPSPAWSSCGAAGQPCGERYPSAHRWSSS